MLKKIKNVLNKPYSYLLMGVLTVLAGGQWIAIECGEDSINEIFTWIFTFGAGIFIGHLTTRRTADK